MAVTRGVTTAQELRLHVKLTFAPQNASPVFARASGQLPLDSGRKLAGGASREALKAAQAGRAVALAQLEEIAHKAAGWASGYYGRLGYDIAVRPVSLGAGWKLAVDGDARTQKWARILESGYGPQDTHDFIRGAQKKRAVKITRASTQPGYYLIVPKVHGKVTRGENGKLTFTPKRDARLGTRVKAEDLMAFEATTEEFGQERRRTFQFYGTGSAKHPDPYRGNPFYPEMKPTGEREGPYKDGSYDPVGDIDWQKDRHGRNVAAGKGVRGTATGNPEWDEERVAQDIRRVGKLVDVTTTRRTRKAGWQAGPGGDLEWKGEARTEVRGQRLDGIPEGKGGGSYAGLRATQAARAVIGTSGANNFRVKSLTDGDDWIGDDPETQARQQQVVSRRGDALQFITLSTRRPLRPRPGREGHRVMAQAAQKMEARLRALIAQGEQEGRQGFRRDAYLETLRSALGRAL